MLYTEDQVDAFVNALQVCIAHEINNSYRAWLSNIAKPAPAGDVFLMSFTSTKSGDKNLDKFKRLVSGLSTTLDKYSHRYQIANFQQLDLSLLTNFLLLTRLQDDQIRAIADQDPRYRPYAKTLGLLPAEIDATPILSLMQARDFIFRTIEKKAVSLAMVAQHAGLSQVSVSNFKAGGDIRLSNLLNITKALGITLTMKQ